MEYSAEIAEIVNTNCVEESFSARECHHITNKMAEAEFDALANDLENMMSSTSLTMPPGCCIFKVPNILLRHNPKAYTPNAFSIGPYHYGKEHLKATQKIKLRYLHDLISRFPDSKAMLSNLVRATRGVQKEARDCYADPFDHISMDEFVKILVLDGCFLIELFRKNTLKEFHYCFNITNQIDDDPIFMMSCMRQFLLHDLILLENQIPWRVLSVLFDITNKGDDQLRCRGDDQRQCLNLLVLLWGFPRLATDARIIGQQLSPPEHPHKHILDMLRNAMVLPSPGAQERNLQWRCMPSATRLSDAGIKFRKGTSSKSLLDIQFNNGVLEIPPLQIDVTTESLLRNLISLEQCLPNCPHIVTSYAMLLDNLINTTNDMEILCKSGIIHNWLNVDDATKFFNQLYYDAFVKESYYTTLLVDVNKYCRRWWPRNRTILMHDYFRHTWARISVVAAVFLLILTFLQTVFSIIK